MTSGAWNAIGARAVLFVCCVVLVLIATGVLR